MIEIGLGHYLTLAEFEAMMGDKKDDEEKEDESIAPEVAPELTPEVEMEGKEDAKEAMHKDKKKMDEYKIQKSADNADHADSKVSPMKTGGAKQGGTPVKTGGGAEDKGRPAPTAQKMSDFENTPGKDKGTSMKKEVKPQTADGSEKSAKSPITGK